MKGLFITFEGIDWCGKTTQARRLVDSLRRRGYPVVFTREPGGPPISEQIRALLLDVASEDMVWLTELFLYMASRAQHTQQLILPSLERGEVVVCDRYADATLAYQGYGRGLDLELIQGLNRIATFGLRPDLTILIDLPPEESRRRSPTQGEAHNRMEREEEGFHRRVRQGYLQIVASEPDRFRVVDGRGTVEEVQGKVWQIVDQFLKERKREGQDG